MKKRKRKRSVLGKLLEEAHIPALIFSARAKIDIATTYKLIYGKAVTLRTAMKACKAYKSFSITKTMVLPSPPDLDIKIVPKKRCRKSSSVVSRKRTTKRQLPKRKHMGKDKPKPPPK